MAVRRGEVAEDEILVELDDLIPRLERTPIAVMSPPARAALEQWLIRAYRKHWDGS
jgi:hypothetical protein